MKVLSLTVVLVAVIQTAVSETCLPPTATTAKVFCYYTNGAKTWAEAKAWCASKGKNIATITHQEESDTLKLAHTNDLDFFGEFWTAARDLQELEQFGWDFPNTNPRPLHYLYNTLLQSVIHLDFQTCLAYKSYKAEAGLVLKKCTDRIGYLCE